MNKIFKLVFIIAIIFIGIRIFVVLNYFYSLKDVDQRNALIDSIGQRIDVLNADKRCHQIVYYKSTEFTCLNMKGGSCRFNNMSLQTLKDTDRKLEEAITNCINLFIR